MSADDNGSLFVYLTNGKIEPYLRSEIDSIRVIDGNHEIWTPDSTYIHPLDLIMKVSLTPPPTIARPNAINLAVDELGKHIIGCYPNEYGGYYLLVDNINTETIQYGTFMYQLEPSQVLPAGFLGKVNYVNDNEIYIDDCNLSDVFDSLAWTGDSSFEAGEGEATTEGDEEYDDEGTDTYSLATQSTGRRRSNNTPQIPTLVAENHYPNLLSGSYTLSDELKEIPVGPERGRVDSKIKVKPIVGCNIGAYVLGGKRGTDGEWEERPAEIYKMHTTVKVNIEAEASGRTSLKASRTIGKDKSVSYSMPLGLGQKCSVTFTGTLKLEGTMGLDYKYSAAYNGASTSSIMIDSDSGLSAALAYGAYTVVSEPQHTLDASMDGNLTLTASLTVSVHNITDSLSAMTTTYAFGSGLSGSALYKTSQLEEAQTNNALYHRITSEGITASPIETISHTLKYGVESLKPKVKIKPSPKEIFYAVPPFESVTRDGATLTFSIKSGRQMDGRRSNLGFKVKNQSDQFTTYPSSAVWSGVKNLTGEPAFDVKKDIVYPTATLCGVTILGTPTYPIESTSMSPIVTYQSDANCVMRSGLPILDSHTTTSTYYLIGYPPVKKGKSKE